MKIEQMSAIPSQLPLTTPSRAATEGLHDRVPTIGVLLHDLNNPLMSKVLSGIGSVAAGAGYDLLTGYAAKSNSKARLQLQHFMARRVDGVIAACIDNDNDSSIFNILRDEKVPTIFLQGAAQYPDGTSVTMDHADCSYQATHHLVKQGCSRIVLVTGPENSELSNENYQGYAEALRNNGFSTDNSLILNYDLNGEAGIAAADAIMRMVPRPDGAFITDDLTAVDCMHRLMDAGWSVPEDLAIVGCTDDFISTVVTPQLTTIQNPGIRMGEIAACSLIDHLNGHDLMQASRIMVRSHLIKRASSQRLGALYPTYQYNY